MITKLLTFRGCAVFYTFSRLSCIQRFPVNTIKRDLTCCQVAWSKKPSPGDVPVKNPSTSENASDKEAQVAVNTIFLLGMDDKPMGSMTYDSAMKMAQKKNLKLVKIEDPVRRMKTDVYKLMSGLQLHDVRVKLRETKKGPQATVEKNDKTMMLTSKISEHDLGTKTKTIRRWITAGHIVRVTINGDGKSEKAMEILYKSLEKEAVEVGGQALQQRTSEDLKTMKFSLQPVSKKKLKTAKSPEDEKESTAEEGAAPKDDGSGSKH